MRQVVEMRQQTKWEALPVPEGRRVYSVTNIVQVKCLTAALTHKKGSCQLGDEPGSRAGVGVGVGVGDFP